jgi:hypothetical protein
MQRFAATLTIGLMGLAGLTPAFGFDADSQAVVDRMKTGKLVPIAEVATLMRGAERWCYRQTEAGCSWSDIYLEVTAEGASYEIGNAWNAVYDIVFTDHGTFEEGRYICETGYDWVPTVRAFRRDDGSPVGGRELHALKQEIIGYRGTEENDCFDYLFEGADAAARTVTLLQRQFTGGVHDPANDVAVTLHFDAESAEALAWYW